METPAAEAPELDLIDVLLRALRSQGYEGEWVEDRIVLASGTNLDCDFIESAQMADGRVRSSSRTVAWNDKYFPEGLLEYQHSSGASLEEALEQGFESWIRLDLALLEWIATDQVEENAGTRMEIPVNERSLTREVVFGPTARLAQNPPADAEEHAFCPCCLFTNSAEALMEAISVDRFLGIRLFAMRNPDGGVQADCRINGEDAPQALPALRDYVASWPDCGFEFRKQYVVVRTREQA